MAGVWFYELTDKGRDYREWHPSNDATSHVLNLIDTDENLTIGDLISKNFSREYAVKLINRLLRRGLIVQSPMDVINVVERGDETYRGSEDKYMKSTVRDRMGFERQTDLRRLPPHMLSAGEDLPESPYPADDWN